MLEQVGRAECSHLNLNHFVFDGTCQVLDLGRVEVTRSKRVGPITDSPEWLRADPKKDIVSLDRR